MTAINIFKDERAVRLFSDTRASVHGLGVGTAIKCLPLPHLNAAIAARGPTRLLSIVHGIAGNLPDYATLRATLPSAISQSIPLQPVEADRAALSEPFDVFVIGWPGSPDAFWFDNHGKHGARPWAVNGIEYGLITPVLSQEATEAAFREDRYDPISIIEAQKRNYPGLVGGHVCETAVSAKGILARIHSSADL